MKLSPQDQIGVSYARYQQHQPPSWNFSCILPGLYQGSAPPPGDQVRRQGFDALVLCAEEWQEADAYPGVEVLRAPNDDGDEPTNQELLTARWAGHEVARRVAKGKRVLVTCHMGWNRSGLVSAIAIMRLLGIPGRDAAKIVRSARPNALTNSWFAKILDQAPAPRGRR